MRVRHLNDFEIQGMLDRRATAPSSEVPGQVYLKDLEAQEHLDNCPDCMAELATYRELFGELEESEKTYLPKNFASKVTFSLPPFRAQRTRARVRMAVGWGIGLMAALIWLLSRLDWSGLAGKFSAALVTNYAAADTWATATIAGLSMPEFNLPSLWPPLVSMLESVHHALLTDGSPASLVLLAGVALVLVASLDRVYSTAAQRQRHLR